MTFSKSDRKIYYNTNNDWLPWLMDTEYYRVECSNFCTSRIRSGENRMIKLLDGVIAIMKDGVFKFWGDRKEVSTGSWSNFQIRNCLLINLHILLRYPHPYILFSNGANSVMGW